MPVPYNKPNGYSLTNLNSDAQKRTIYGSDPSLCKSNNNKSLEQNGHCRVGYLDPDRRRRVSSASNATNGAVENGNSMSNGTTHHMNGHASPVPSVGVASGHSSSSSSSSKSTCRDICIHLAYDVIFAKLKGEKRSGWLWKSRPNGLTADNEYTKTMHRTVAEISERHDILFSSMVKKLNITRENYDDVFIKVVDDIFSDQQINWGRIVSVYALGEKIAKYFVESGMDDCLDGLSERVGSYVYETLGDWIMEKGGWDEFVRFFPEQRTTDERVWNGLLMAVGIAGAAGLATLLSMKP